jgi:hypothetical protein
VALIITITFIVKSPVVDCLLLIFCKRLVQRQD